MPAVGTSCVVVALVASRLCDDAITTSALQFAHDDAIAVGISHLRGCLWVARTVICYSKTEKTPLSSFNMGDEEDDDSELEDDDYNPDLDDTGEAGEGARAKKRSKKSSK